MTSPTYGGGGSDKRGHYSINLLSKMSDKGEGGVKNLKIWVMSFMEYGWLPIYFFYLPMHE